MKKINLFFITSILLISVACSSETKKPVEQSVENIALIENPEIEINITGKGIGGKGKAFWINCTGHNSKTVVVLNGIVCETTYYEDHLTCVIPERFVGLAEDKIEVNFAENSIEIHSFGRGGDNNSAIWVNCTGHTKKTKIFIEGQELETIYYEDHLTALIPQNKIGKDKIGVVLKDKESNIVSSKFEL